MSSKVVVTGSRGYVGTATKELLEDSGYEVIEIDKKIGRNTIYLFSYLISDKPIAIIHLSAKKSIPESKKKPWIYYFNNVLSTLSTAIVAKVSSIPVVFASSAAVYTPSSAYARAKIVEEKILGLLCPKLAVLRYFNIVGKTATVNDYGSTNLFEIIRRQPKITINSISSTRDYVHVLDIARANVMAMEHLQSNGSFITDIFTGEARTLMDVMKEYKINGLTVDYTILGLDDASTIPTLDNRAIFGWKPKYTFKQAIKSEIKEK
jgi:nucleoside-diphosphate-sugar epimerase